MDEHGRRYSVVLATDVSATTPEAEVLSAAVRAVDRSTPLKNRDTRADLSARMV